MTFPATTNVDGINPGPNAVYLPDTTQAPVGNIIAVGTFEITLTPSSVAATSAVEELFAATGIGLKTTDAVVVNPPSTTTGVVQAAAYVKAADELAIQFINPTAAAEVPPAGVYRVTVFRVQPNWTAPASGYQMDY